MGVLRVRSISRLLLPGSQVAGRALAHHVCGWVLLVGSRGKGESLGCYLSAKTTSFLLTCVLCSSFTH
jgi:hypothetical protein